MSIIQEDLSYFRVHLTIFYYINNYLINSEANMSPYMPYVLLV